MKTSKTNRNTALKALSTLLAILLALTISACGKKNDTAANEAVASDAADSEKTIVCSMYPVYDFTRRIAGDGANVYMLLPPGADNHGYEPSVGDMVTTDKADLFIYTDDEMEVWVKNMVSGLSHVRLARAAEGMDLEALNEEWEKIENHDEDEHEHEHEHKYDAHIWLDPTLAMGMCENIKDALKRIDPQNAEKFEQNALALINEIDTLDKKFITLFEAHPSAVIYFGGEFSYSHFIRRYGVKYISAYDGCSEEDEISLGEVIRITEALKREENKVIFTDELSSGEIANQIAEETGAKVLVFHSCHTVSEKELNLSYIDIMNRNLDNLLTALGEK